MLVIPNSSSQLASRVSVLEANIGSGGNAPLVQSLAFSTAIRFNYYTTLYATHTVTGAIAFTVNTSGVIPGSSSVVRLIANGGNSPTFTGFKESVGSAQYDNRSNILNLVQFFYDGVDYWYSILQELGASGGGSADINPPLLSAISISSGAPARIVVQYNEVLSSAHIPATSAFTVPGKTVTAVTRSTTNAAHMWVDLSSGFSGGQSGTISYSVPGTNSIRDAAGNVSGPFTNEPFSLPATDTIAPTLQSVSISSGTPGRVTLNYDEALSNNVPATSAYTVTGGRTVNSVSVSGSTVSVDFTPVLAGGSSASISYSVPGTNSIRDAAGNISAAFSGQAFSLPAVDTTAPTLQLVSMSSATPGRVTLNYDEALNTTAPPVSAFTIAGGRTVNTVSILGSAVSVNFTPILVAGNSSSISYGVPGTNPIRDAAGNTSAAFSNQAFSLPGEPAPESLLFTTRTANLTQDSSGNLIATSPSYSTTYALADKKIPANTDGWVGFDYLSIENRDFLMGLNTSETNEQFSGYEFFMWAGTATGAFRAARDGNSTGADVVPAVTVGIGDKYRIGRFGGIMKVQRLPSGGSSWVDLKVWEANASQFFINIAMNKTRGDNPVISGGVLR